MPELERFLPRYIAEPPQEAVPYGRWEQTLRDAFLQAVGDIDADEDLLGEHDDIGEPGDLVFFPDRTWHGRTFIPVSARTSNNLEVFGHVRFIPGDEEDEPRDFEADADVTDELAEANPDWKIDLAETVVGSWRGDGDTAAITLVWGRPLVPGAAHALAELDGTIVDRCIVRDGCFTLLSVDDYKDDTLQILIVSSSGEELVRESLYVEAEEE